METPSSTTRVPRSHAISATTNPLSSSSSKDKSSSIPRNQDRSALFDITNDSPIVGLALQTPSSGKRNMSRIIIKNTPGTGEALLRGQVKNLLQKVEEEAVLTKISMESRPFIHLVSSPMGLLAPTPANTPQVLDFDEKEEMKIVITAPVVAGQCNLFEESPSVTRSLMLDFSSDCSSVVTQNTEDDNDNSSIWSMQVNASIKDEEDYEEDEVCSYNEEDVEDEYYEEEEEEVDVLCEGMKKMSVAGKHVRFVYDNEDEEIVEAKEESSSSSSSPGVLRLNGFPTPKGKHVRFAGDE